MEVTNLVCYVLLFLIFCHYATKIFEWWAARNKKETNLAEFMADLYKLQDKWSRKGEFHFCKAIELIKNATAPDEQEAEQSTDEGRRIVRAMKEQIAEEIIQDYK